MQRLCYGEHRHEGAAVGVRHAELALERGQDALNFQLVYGPACLPAFLALHLVVVSAVLELKKEFDADALCARRLEAQAYGGLLEHVQ